VQRGRDLIEKSGCAGCHSIPGIRSPAAASRVGPPLDAFARRLYIAGMLPNTPEQLARWVYDPLAINPKTGMPRVGLTEQESRDVAAYLSTLK
jgi:cytochrome c1